MALNRPFPLPVASSRPVNFNLRTKQPARLSSANYRNSQIKQTTQEFSFLHQSMSLTSSSSSSPPPSFPPIDHHGASCSCGRRRFLESIGTTALLPVLYCSASEGDSSSPAESSMEALKRFHPPKPDWYENLYAYVLGNFMEEYEVEIAGYKSELFSELKGNNVKDIVEIGIGTGPNLKYYANDASKRVFGVDPNKKMEKYAKEAAEDAGLPANNFEFRQAVGEVLPLDDASVDAVIGTLVLCSVTDVNRTLEEVKRVLRPGGLYLFVEHVAAEAGTFRRFAQNTLNPIQQFVADGCHLTRETGKSIAEAGFSEVDKHLVFISKASIINPHVYGIARK